jgi:hypothetical protein
MSKIVLPHRRRQVQSDLFEPFNQFDLAVVIPRLTGLKQSSGLFPPGFN